jgi:hypothetical protein
MQTKLQRIDDLMRNAKDRKQYADGDYARLASELDDQLGNFRDENSVLKDRVRKLKTIHSGLTSQLERGGITNTSANFNKKPRGTSTRGQQPARRPSTSTKRNVDLSISHASGTMGGLS